MQLNAEQKVTIFHQALVRGGGMEHYAMMIATAFKELGWNVCFFGREADAGLAKELDVQVELAPRARCSFRKLRDWQFFRMVKDAAPRLPGMHIALSRVPVKGLVVCGGTHKGFLRAAKKLKGPFDWLQTILESSSYAHAARVISHSGLCTRELESLYHIPASRIATLYPPVKGRFQPGDQQAARKTLGLPPEKLVLLFPSMGHTRKGLGALCEALSQFSSEIILAVAGKPADGLRFPFVLPLGYVENMVSAYQAADFTILGSWYEPFGMVGPESVLCGTKLLFEEKIGCLPALSRDAALLFNIARPETIRTAVKEALLLKKAERHRIQDPRSALLYDPDPMVHARSLIREWQASMGVSSH